MMRYYLLRVPLVLFLPLAFLRLFVPLNRLLRFAFLTLRAGVIETSFTDLLLAFRVLFLERDFIIEAFLFLALPLMPPD